MRTSELDYDLPSGLVAVRPAEPRDSARLMLVDRSNPADAAHRTVRDLPEILRAGDLLVFNTARVLPARLIGVRRDTGGRFEGLYLRDARSGDPDSIMWAVLLRGKSVHAGITIDLWDRSGSRVGATLRVVERAADEPGAWIVGVEGGPTGQVLERVGRTPLPPYIIKARRDERVDIADDVDRARYQTVYARESGSVAAPTAGLHFTPGLLDRLGSAGVERAEVHLEVGSGTFKPIETEVVEDHPIHSERCWMSGTAADQVLRAKAEGRRVIAVGTTSARTLESFAPRLEARRASPASAWSDSMETRLLISPPYRWRVVDGVVTNFHLPRSTLLAMVGALLPGGVETLKRVYASAIAARYRFYSYGDAMAILP